MQFNRGSDRANFEKALQMVVSAFRISPNYRDEIEEALRAFAEAVRSNCDCDHKHDHCGKHNQCVWKCWQQNMLHEKPPEPVHVCGQCPKCGPIIHSKEPKECAHDGFKVCRLCGLLLNPERFIQPPADLPAEVLAKMIDLNYSKEIGMKELDAFARLCLRAGGKRD